MENRPTPACDRAELLETLYAALGVVLVCEKTDGGTDTSVSDKILKTIRRLRK